MKHFMLLGLVLLTACASSTANPGVDAVNLSITDTPGLSLLVVSDTPGSQPTLHTQSTLESTPMHPVIEGTPVEKLFNCDVVRKTPADNTLFEPGTDISVQFWLKNTGIRTWVSGLKLSYLSGGGIVTDAHHVLPEVLPGEEVGPFEFVMHLPIENGTYTLQYQLGKFCFPYVQIKVER